MQPPDQREGLATVTIPAVLAVSFTPRREDAAARLEHTVAQQLRLTAEEFPRHPQIVIAPDLGANEESAHVERRVPSHLRVKLC
jgi:hypothetical protein